MNGKPGSVSAPITTRPRLWPAWVILGLQLVTLVTSVTPSVNLLERFQAMMFGPLACVVLFLAWLMLGSRIPWRERFAILAGLIAFATVAAALIDRSMAVAMFIYGIPLAMAAITLALFIARDWPTKPRVVINLAFLAVVWSVMLFWRLEGFTGNYHPQFAWRWSATEEEQLSPLGAVAGDGATVEPAAATSWSADQGEWPSFRGAGRDGRAGGLTYELNWATAPPQELWRTSVGPAWSSFAYVAGRLFTQEQRGQDEAISCYDAEDGQLIWAHTETARFTEVVSGAGPRATPTFHEGRLLTYGATGILCALDAASGELIWRHDFKGRIGRDDGSTMLWHGAAANDIRPRPAIVQVLAGTAATSMTKCIVVGLLRPGAFG